MIDVIFRHWSELLGGLRVTLALCAICWSLSLLCGGTLGVMGAKWSRQVGKPSQVVSVLLAGVPPIVFLFWLYYPAQAILNISVDPFTTTWVAISILSTFMVADLVRNALIEFPEQYETAGYVCGLNYFDMLFMIKIPILLRGLVSGFLSIAILVLQMTLFASFISVGEIFRVAQRINSVEYKPIEIFTALTFFIMLICVPVQIMAIGLRKRYSRDLSER